MLTELARLNSAGPFAGRLDLAHIGMFGHSLGGATAASTMRVDPRIDAGADLVIGNLPHWAGALELYKGVPSFYALGDFVFNIDRSEQTEEGIVVELSFAGSRLVQARLLPYLILDGAQPNLLDPAGSGNVVLKQVFGASPGLPW